jgi:hypothetical protein
VKNLLILSVALLVWGQVGTAVGTADPRMTSQPRQPNFLGGGDKERSPFEAVRWRGSVPEVKVKGQWYRLLALNDLPSKRIVGYAQTVDKNDWKKRFEEDLVELLSSMGYEPGAKVKLKLWSLDSGKTKELKDIPMTKENRRAVQGARHEKR